MIRSFNALWFTLVAALLLECAFLASGAPASQRKAIIVGRGDPYRDAGGSRTHPQVSAANFLRLVGNPDNDPAKGWTLDFTWDLMVRLGMDPTNTPLETLFQYINKHGLGYRIAMNCGPNGYASDAWNSAVENGMMPFGPQGENHQGARVDDPVGLRAGVGCAGGYTHNLTSFGPGVEFVDHAFPTDYAQSWANQAVAAKYAWLLDAHPQYNIWDARQHLRQAGSFWASGWTETNGYGVVNTNVAAAVLKLLPGPPVDFAITRSRDHHQVSFTWRNFRQSDFAATVVARKDGRVLYDGIGTNLVWNSDLDGEETFVYWSRNQVGQKSRLESYQHRRVTGLTRQPRSHALVLGAPAGQEALNDALAQGFQAIETNWLCDLIYRPGHSYYDRATSFPIGSVMAILPGFEPMVDYAISNHCRIVIVPNSSTEPDLFAFKGEWDRATTAGILVVLPHHTFASISRKAAARRLSPPRLYSAITVGAGVTSNLLSFGPGLEFFDAPVASDPGSVRPGQLEAAAVVAGKLARILDANPQYNLWDARQHLRQSSSGYAAGWVEDGGYGRPPAKPARIKQLDPAPPLDLQAEKSDDARSVTFSWVNFRQTGFAQTVIARDDKSVIYQGSGTNFVWRSDSNGDTAFHFFSQDNSGRRSRPESYTTLRVEGLKDK